MTDEHPVTHIDDVVHQRARLGVMAILSEADEADFSTIRASLELTAGNLSRHLAVLEDSGLITVRKTFEGKRPRTWVSATELGHRSYAAELDRLRDLIRRFDTHSQRPDHT